jgi:regulator of sigma E protease
MGFTFQEILAFIAVLGIIVTLHEFGHFAAARLCGMRADVFALGMGMRLLGWNKITGFTFGKLPETWDGGGHTDYRLCLLPIGGYVKIIGMIDESMDTTQLKSEPQPYEFRSKNALQKAFVISAGVIMNFILAITVFFSLALFNGKEIHPITTIGYVEKSSVAEKFGFRAGDKILKVGTESVSSWEDALSEITIKDLGANRTVVVEREGRTQTLTTNGSEIINAITNKKDFGLLPLGVKILIAQVEPAMPALKAGLQANDTLISINNELIKGADQFMGIIASNGNKPLEFAFKRGNDEKHATVYPTFDDGQKRYRVGIVPAILLQGDIVHRSFSFGESVSFGWNETVRQVSGFFGIIGKIFGGSVSFKNTIGGPIQIMRAAGKVAELGFSSFMNLVAMLSVSIAVLNILPIPALDGGHLVFIIIEAIIRREVPIKVKMAVQQVGMFLLLALMVVVLYNDIVR